MIFIIIKISLGTASEYSQTISFFSPSMTLPQSTISSFLTLPHFSFSLSHSWRLSFSLYKLSLIWTKYSLLTALLPLSLNPLSVTLSTPLSQTISFLSLFHPHFSQPLSLNVLSLYLSFTSSPNLFEFNSNLCKFTLSLPRSLTCLCPTLPKILAFFLCEHMFIIRSTNLIFLFF